MTEPTRKAVQDIVRRHMRHELYVGGIFEHPRDGRVRILGGCYFDPTYGRLSNHWSWTKLDENDLPIGEKLSGYGWT